MPPYHTRAHMPTHPHARVAHMLPTLHTDCKFYAQNRATAPPVLCWGKQLNATRVCGVILAGRGWEHTLTCCPTRVHGTCCWLAGRVGWHGDRYASEAQEGLLDISMDSEREMEQTLPKVRLQYAPSQREQHCPRTSSHVLHTLPGTGVAPLSRGAGVNGSALADAAILPSHCPCPVYACWIPWQPAHDLWPFKHSFG